ncbi:hypothetical protein APHAL10511_000800 [Amanita phalloides]|nr:hypothetical protein APHAL10511_000800 [Amanita phalloides]
MPHLSRTETASTSHHNVRIDVETCSSPNLSSASFDSEDSHRKWNKAKRQCKKIFRSLKRPWRLPQSLQWMPANFTRDKLKPVVRCAVSAWVAVVLFVIPSVNKFIGPSAFFIMVASIMSPPSDPFMFVLERELLLLLFSSFAWAWSCMGIFFASLVRHNTAKVSLAAAVTGKFLETAPTIIISVWIFLGSAALLYVRARQGPGPYFFTVVLACMTLDAAMQTGLLFPAPDYLVGRSVMIALSFHSAVALLSSIFIFPKSISSQFINRLQHVLSPLASALELHQKLLNTPHISAELTSLSTQTNLITGKAEDALVPLSASARLLKDDLIYSRFAPYDFICIQEHLARLIGRATGMAMYFTFIDPMRDKFAMTPMPSLPPSPMITPMPSRSPSPERHTRREDARRMVRQSSDGPPSPPHSPALSRSPSRFSHSHSYSHNPHSQHIHYKLLHLKRSARHEHAVGIFELQKYLNLEATHLHTPLADMYACRTLKLLHESCDELLTTSREAIMTTHRWLGGVFHGRFRFWHSAERKRSERQRRVNELKLVRDRLWLELECFRRNKRHVVLDPYKNVFDSNLEEQDVDPDHRAPPHRYLFYCYVYQYHLMQFGDLSLKMLDNIIGLEEKRHKESIWTPAKHLFRWSVKAISEKVEKDYEEDPDCIEGIETCDDSFWTRPQRRDPDALPPSNVFERVSDCVYQVTASVCNGNLLYAVKAGVLTVLLFFPCFFQKTAPSAYRERFLWVIFMGQLTLNRFRGDTAFVFVARITATFFGGVIGMAIWYLAAGRDNHGSPYGIAAIFAVCFPLIFYVMLYWPIPPLTHVIMFTTVVLVFGFSYQDVREVLPNSAGVGFTVAWRRFLLVVIGVSIAFFVSYLPPSTTIRQYHRKLLSRTSCELGTIYCQVISFANSRRQTEVPEIMTNLLAIRRKLRKAQSVRRNVRYELSFRGKWPAKRYLAVLDNQLQIAFSLSHLMAIVEHLQLSWSRAFLRRTRFNDMNFQGDILAVITMISTALRTGQPLPQITPCPLLDRFMLRFHGLEVIHKEFLDDYGLPKQLTLETLRDEQYMAFCVGVSTAFSIMSRLDRLMVAAKEIVGEQYYIDGMGLGHHGGVEMGSRTESIQLRAPGIV